MSSNTEAQLLAYVIKYNDLLRPQRAGIGQDYFHDEWRTVYRYLHSARRDHDAVPSIDTVQARFPDLDFPRVRRTDLPQLLADIRKRKQWIEFLTVLQEAAEGSNSPDDIQDTIQEMQGRLNSLAFSGSTKSHLVDFFSQSASKAIRDEMREQKRAGATGLPTGLPTLDAVIGGLQKQRMVTVMARPGVGKSWVDLWFLANGVNAGGKFMLYPLEMTLYETAMRLYSIFTQMHFGPTKALRNLDLTSGKVSPAKLAKFTSILEDKFAGQLYIADVGSLSDPYTNERIEAEVEAHKPDGFWVDYINLLKSTGDNRNDSGPEKISKLSKGIKNTAMRRKVIGGASAQVNRSGTAQGSELKNKGVFLPRLENIYAGDAIGQDSDQVISLASQGRFLYYALVKNRHGPEIGKTKLLKDFNNGILREETMDEDEDD